MNVTGSMTPNSEIGSEMKGISSHSELLSALQRRTINQSFYFLFLFYCLVSLHSEKVSLLKTNFRFILQVWLITHY